MYRNEQTTDNIEDLEYVRSMGAYKPHFEGISEHYYPLSCGQLAISMAILIFTILTVLGIMIGFQFWVLATGLQVYDIVWTGLVLLFFVICIGLLYKGGKDRRAMEKALIEENTQKQKEMLKNKL